MSATTAVLPYYRLRGAMCALLLGVTLVGCARNPGPIGPEGILGERARVQFDTGRSETGILRGFEGDTVTLETEPAIRRRIPLTPTARLEISQMTSKAGKGAGLGALIGGGGLAIVGAVSCSGDDGLLDPGPGACAAGGALLGAGAGALVGLVIGSTSKSERWVEVDRSR